MRARWDAGAQHTLGYPSTMPATQWPVLFSGSRGGGRDISQPARTSRADSAAGTPPFIPMPRSKDLWQMGCLLLCNSPQTFACRTGIRALSAIRAPYSDTTDTTPSYDNQGTNWPSVQLHKQVAGLGQAVYQSSYTQREATATRKAQFA